MSEEKTCGVVKPSQVYCEVCNVYVSSASLLATHIKGKKHQQLQKLRQTQDKAAKLSVYVTGFKCSETNEDEMSSFFSSFGKVKTIYFDKNKGAFAIVDFEDEKSVSDILGKEEPIVFKGKNLRIKKRAFTKQKAQEKQEPSQSLEQNPRKRKKRHSSETNIASFLPGETIDKLKQLTSVSQQIDLLKNELQLTDEDIQLRSLICKVLEEVFKEFSPSVEVVLYGSSASGLGYKGSDLDLTILLDKDTLEVDLESEDTDSRFGAPTKSSKVYMFVVKVLRSLVPGCSHVIPIYSAKCPVIKFTHQSSGLSCDLTINNRLGIRNTRLLRCYMSLDPRVPQLVYVIRAWAKALGISGGDSSHLTSYALTLMVIYYLQTTNPQVVPSLQNISGWPMNAEGGNDDNGKEKDKCHIDGWDCSFYEDITMLSASLNSKPVEKLLEEFFYFYGSKFDYGNCAVNIRKGERCTIMSLEEELEEIKHKMNYNDVNENIFSSEASTASGTSLVKMESKEEIDRKSDLDEVKEEEKPREMGTVWKTTPICVQDPFELTHNVTQNIGVSSLRNIIHCMMDGRRICSTFPSDGNLTESDGIVAFFKNTSRISPKRKKKEGYSFAVYLCKKSELDKASSSKIPAAAIVCSKHSTIQELFDAFCQYLEHELQMKCGMESIGSNQNTSGYLSATCTALTNTWTKCRRERRKIMKGKDDISTTSDMEKSHSAVLDSSLEQESETHACAMEQSSSSIEPHQVEVPTVHQQQDNKKPVLIFRLILLENKDCTVKDCMECVVKLEHIEGNGLQTFENFYAFFKKQIQNIFI